MVREQGQGPGERMWQSEAPVVRMTALQSAGGGWPQGGAASWLLLLGSSQKST